MIHQPKMRLYMGHNLKILFYLWWMHFFKNCIHRGNISSLVLIETGPLLWARKKSELTLQGTQKPLKISWYIFPLILISMNICNQASVLCVSVTKLEVTNSFLWMLHFLSVVVGGKSPDCSHSILVKIEISFYHFFHFSLDTVFPLYPIPHMIYMPNPILLI